MGERERVWERESARVGESECGREREYVGERERVWERESACERERVRVRERECV